MIKNLGYFGGGKGTATLYINGINSIHVSTIITIYLIYDKRLKYFTNKKTMLSIINLKC